MPFTFAHPAIVLPLGNLSKRWFSLTGLVIGSMTPDFEYFIRMRVKSIYSHTLTGLFWFDLPLGLILVYIYLRWVKKPLIDHLPKPLNERLSSFKAHSIDIGFSWMYFAVLSVSILIGTASHLLWDGFTHPTGYFVSAVPILKHIEHIGSHQVYTYKLFQHLSTLLGLAVILIATFKLPKHRQILHVDISSYWFQTAGVTAITLLIRLLSGLSYRQYGHVVVTAIAGFWLGLLLASVLSLRKGRLD
ncbi:DUF4184 family protein [Mucilaginibacter sp. PAMB04274]|uniref:DUF4184 family protein n=1 Tax=Mucilaginibacter sp. PAMB04274 TaxID=3138568 RepID=UPI0031F620CD